MILETCEVQAEHFHRDCCRASNNEKEVLFNLTSRASSLLFPAVSSGLKFTSRIFKGKPEHNTASLRFYSGIFAESLEGKIDRYRGNTQSFRSRAPRQTQLHFSIAWWCNLHGCLCFEADLWSSPLIITFSYDCKNPIYISCCSIARRKERKLFAKWRLAQLKILC